MQPERQPRANLNRIGVPIVLAQYRKSGAPTFTFAASREAVPTTPAGPPHPLRRVLRQAEAPLCDASKWVD